MALVPCAIACADRSGYDGPFLRFDGDDDHIEIGTVHGDDPLALAGAPFTVGAWFLQEDGGDLYQRIIDKSDERLGHDGWALCADSRSGQIHLYSHDGSHGADFVSRHRAYSPGRWHHVMAVTRVDRHEIWIDGERHLGAYFEEGEHAFPGRFDTELRLGTWNHDRGREWKGLLGEVAVWKRDLAPGEIAAVAAARGRLDLRDNSGAYHAASDLVGYWRMTFAPGSADEIPDLSPSRAHGRWVKSR